MFAQLPLVAMSQTLYVCFNIRTHNECRSEKDVDVRWEMLEAPVWNPNMYSAGGSHRLASTSSHSKPLDK